MILPIYTKEERERMKPILKKIVEWLENNKELKDTDYYKNTEAEAVALYEAINNL